MDRIFLDILNLSIAGSWLILAVLLLRPLMKKAPRSIVCALWLVVGLRLMLPFSIESALSLIPSRETLNPEILEPGMASAAMPALESGARFIDSGVELIDRAVNPVISQSVAPRPEYSVNPMQALSFIAGCVWLMGFALMVGYSISSYIRLRLRMRETVPVEKNVRQGSAVESPFVLGLFSPRIYLPAGLSEKDRPLVLAHERAHIRRGDNFIKPLGFLLLAVHWFNPLVWLGYILLCRDIESACDERVVKELGSDIRRDYSMALLNCSCGRRAISACPLAFGEISVKSRIKGVLNYKKPSFWITLLALLGCAVLAVCFLTDPVDKTDETPAAVSTAAPAPTAAQIPDSVESPQPRAFDSSLFFVVPAAGEGADYVPAQLSQIRPDDHESGPLYLDARAADSLNAMLEDCRAAGHKVELFRAYESYEEGVAMYLEQYPDDSELTHFADLSYGWYRAPLKRDLQSGLSVVLADTAQGLGYPLSEENGFDETEAWLDGHCTDYGFVLRFPQEKMNLTGKGGPRGMYRYVGREAAEYMAENKLCLEEFMLLNELETPSTDLGQFEMEVLGAYSAADDYLCYVKFSPIEPEHLKNGALRINAIHTVSDSRLALIPAGTQLDGTASYDEAGKTLTVCFYAANYREELGESWPLDVEVKMALYGNPLASPGSLSFPAPETESRQLMLDEPLEFSVEGLENPIRLMGVELRPCAVAALMEWQDSERFFHPGTDFSLLSDEDKEWISKVNTSFTQASLQCSSMGIRFADGSSMNTSAGRYGPRFEDGLLMQWSYEFPQPIDLAAVVSVTLGGKTVEIS